MAIKSLETRLDEMTQVESQAPGIKTTEYYEPVNEAAVKNDTVLKNLKSLPADATPSEQMEATTFMAVDADKPENVTKDEPILVAAAGPFKMFGKKTKEAGKEGALHQQQQLPTPKEPAPGLTAEEAKASEGQLQQFEQVLETTPVSGKPPELPINVDRIDGPDDFKQSINAVAQSTGIKTYGMTWEQTKADAFAKGVHPNQLADLDAFQKKYGSLPSELLNVRLAAIGNARLFYDAARKAGLNPDDVEMQAEVLYLFNRQKAYNDTYALMRARAAQATAAGNIQITPGMMEQFMQEAGDIKLPSASSADMKALLADPTTSENLKYMIDKFMQLDDPMAREGMLTDLGKGGLVKELIDRSWKNGLLSATGTHLVNLSSNTVFLASTVATRQMAGVISTLKRASGGQGEVELGEAAAMIAGMWHAQKDAFSLAWKALKTGENVEMRRGTELASDAGTRYEGQYRIFNARDYGVETEWLVKGINGYANFVTLLGGRPIMAMDEYFKTIGYRAELYAQAYRAQQQARREALAAAPVKDAQAVANAELAGINAMEDVLRNPSKEITDLADDFTHMITFSRKLTGSSAQIQELAKSTLVGRMALPYVKAPIWIASESLQHSYLAPLSKQWRADMAAGGARRELAIAKFGMGSAMMTAIGSLVADGRITGGGPGNTALRQQYLASGWRPYSFVFRKGEWDDEFIQYLKSMGLDPSIAGDGRLYVPFRGLEPLSGPMAIIADTVEYARYEDDPDVVSQVVMGSTWGLYNYVGQLPVMTAMAGIAGAFTSEIPNPKMAFKNALDGMVKQGATYVTGVIPFQSARNQYARSLDPERRDVRGDPYLPTGVKGLDNYLNYIYSITPGLSKDLPATHDYLGRPEYRGDPANPWISAASGIRYSEGRNSEADRIINNLQVPIEKPKASIDVQTNSRLGSISVKLTPKEHQELLKNISEVLIEASVVDPKTGSVERKLIGIEEAIVAAAADPTFIPMDKGSKQAEMKEIYSKYVTGAKRKLLMENPQIIERGASAAIDRENYGAAK